MKEALEVLGFQDEERFQLAHIQGRYQGTSFLFPDELEQAESWVAGRQANVYVGANPLKPRFKGQKASRQDIAAGRILLVDLDPAKTKDDPQGLADWKRNKVSETLDELVSWLEQVTGTRPARIDSGRGQQLWLRVSGDVDRKKLHDTLTGRFKRAGVSFDGTHNTDRLVRLPGTVNQRTGRVACVIDRGNGSVLSAELAELLAEPVVLDSRATEADEDLVRSNRTLSAIWGDSAPADRSKRDALFVLECLRSGVSEQATARLLWALPSGKAAEDRRGEDYWKSTLGWARGQLAEEERLLVLAKSLPERAASEGPGIAFEAESLKALALLKDSRLADWVSLRHKLKKAQVPLTMLEKELTEERAAQPRDDLVRHGIVDSKDAGWFLRTGGGAVGASGTADSPGQSADSSWVNESFSNVRVFLKGQGLDVDAVMAAAVGAPWALVNEPFQPTEVEGRRWNRSGAKLKVKPTEGEHPAWDQLLSVCGRGLDEAVLTDGWCLSNGVRTGAEYLRTWIAAMIQEPHAPIAYLFFFGPENCGKSSFHEAIGHCLLEGGYMAADTALTSEGSFNGELQGQVLCYVEETDLGAKRGRAINRIKAWVTSPTLTIHRKGKTPYTLSNTTHWIQTANKPGYCPIFPGDTRITAIHLEALRDADRIEKPLLFKKLHEEARAFLKTLLDLELPSTGDGRLRVPAIATEAKRQQQEAARTELEVWIENTPEWLTMDDNELLAAFLNTLSYSELRYWNRGRVGRELPAREQKLRRLALRLISLSPWEGTVSELLSLVGWGSPNSLGMALKKLEEPLARAGYVLTRGSRHDGSRVVRCTQAEG